MELKTPTKNFFLENNLVGDNLIDWYDKILNTMPAGVIVLDKNAKIVYVNNGSLNFNDVSREKFLGQNIKDLEKEGFFKPSAGLISLESKKVESVIQSLRNKKKLLVTAYPIFDSSKELSSVIVISSDVTEHLKTKEQLEEKEAILKHYTLSNPTLSFSSNSFDNFLSQKMGHIQSLVNKVSKTDLTVLFTGESGVGKTFWAKKIHEESPRFGSPFVTINCSAIPETLLESELFGYEDGAFTGALKKGKVGLFEQANSGTVFLDEIGELSLSTQVKLLQVIQDREIRRVGGSTVIPVDFRLITATNQNLENAIKSKQFREDLYYRIKGLTIEVPALRNVPEEIPQMVLFFLTQYNIKYLANKKMSQKAITALKEYSWPGNIRELEHVMESVCAMSEYDLIGLEDLPDIVVPNRSENGFNLDSKKNRSLSSSLEILEEHLIKESYKKHPNSYLVAKDLEISQASAWRKIQKYCNL